MSDIYVPGVKSRFNTEKLIEDLMKVERAPKERTEKNIEGLETEKGYWQEVGRRMNSLRDSARLLFSFQNPFNDRIAVSSDESVITGSATREAVEQDYRFTVKQTALADRFLSSPLDGSFRVDGGTYTFTAGKDEISFNFRGGSLKEFADALNRRGRDKIAASLITVKPGTKSLLIESKISGEENRLGFSDMAEELVTKTGIAEKANDSRVIIAGDELRVNSGGQLVIPFTPHVAYDPALTLKFETATELKTDAGLKRPEPPPGPDIPSSGSVSYGGVTIENDPASVPVPVWTPPALPRRVDNMNVLSITFSDGSTRALPPISDTSSFDSHQYNLSEITGGKTIVSMSLVNTNTHRDISIRNIQVLDPGAIGGFKPANAISTAQDAILSMEGIEIRRPVNNINDLIPGVTVTVRNPSDRTVTLGITPDRESVKDALITLTGNYNRLMAEINVLTRRDDRIIEELSYLSKDEQDEMKKRQGAFQGDTTLNQLKSTLQRVVSSPYPTSQERDLALLSQIGIGVDVRRSGAGGGYDPSRLRGYLEIDENALDMALETRLPVIKELFGSDTNGDLITDTGLAFSVDALTKPYVESNGFISLKTGTIDSKISQDKRRIETMERQLAAKEADLKIQYGSMEGAYNRMEQMSTSLDNFSRQNSSANR
jgi:flagellar hook-associated protein 2